MFLLEQGISNSLIPVLIISCLFYKNYGCQMFILVYIDDIVVIGSLRLEKFIGDYSFSIKDMDPISSFWC